VELTIRQVHGNAQRIAFLIPGLSLVAGMADNPFADGDNGAAVFRDRQKLIGGQQTMFWVSPPQKRFCADNSVLVTANQRLEEKFQFVSAHCIAQETLHFLAFNGPGVDLGVIKLIRISARAFSVVHGDIRFFHQFFAAVTVIRKHTDPDTGGRVYRNISEHKRCFEDIQDFFEHDADIIRLGKIRHHYREFIPTEAGHGIGLADTVSEPLGHFPQQVIATVVAECVVYQLEAVEVQKHQGQFLVVAPRLGQFQREEIHKKLPVRQISQRVVICLVFDDLFQLFAFCYVAGNDRIAAYFPLCIQYRRRCDRDLDLTAVFFDACCFKILNLSAAQNRLQESGPFLITVGRNYYVDLPADDFPGRITENILRPPVPAGNDTVQRYAENSVI